MAIGYRWICGWFRVEARYSLCGMAAMWMIVPTQGGPINRWRRNVPLRRPRAAFITAAKLIRTGQTREPAKSPIGD